MGRPRSPSRKAFPPNLQQNAAGYFSWRDPRSGKSHGIGRDRQAAFMEARSANAMLAQEESRTLVEKIKVSDCPALSQWVDDWIADISTGLAHKTIKNHKSALSKLKATCGHLSLREITPKMIADVLEGYDKAGQGRMAELMRATSFDLFRAAEVRGHLEVGKNPVTSTKAKGSKVKRTRLSLELFLKVYEQTKKPWLKRAMELALVTSQRRGDVQAMRRTDIVDGHLQVDQRKSGGLTKLGIPLTLRLDAVNWSLKEIVERCRTAGLISPHLVHHRKAGGLYGAGDPLTLNRISNGFAEEMRALAPDLDEGRTLPTFHEIRSLAIRLYTLQSGKEFAQTLAGHKDMKTTLLYTDPRDSEAVRIMIPDPTIRTNIERVSNDGQDD